MTTVLKTGTRLRSQVCPTEVIIVRPPATPTQLTCGGHPMIDIAAAPAGGLDVMDGADGGTQLGKRYTRDSDGLEVLVTKAGRGSLAADGAILAVKDAKPLPSSD